MCTIKIPGLSDNRKGILDNLVIPTNGIALTGKEDIRLECMTPDLLPSQRGSVSPERWDLKGTIPMR